MSYILGVDPGLQMTGLGLIQSRDGHYFYVAAHTIAPPSEQALHLRIQQIFLETTAFLQKHRPGVMVIEKLIFARNAQTALKLGHARGALLLAAAQAGVEVVDYTPREVKLAVTGNGAASKQQVQRMVQAVLEMASLPEPHDVADALALAICHAHRHAGKFLAE
jgi:crossover junction endodeoxyribonuclease RuvC